jgi:hypothetical protein
MLDDFNIGMYFAAPSIILPNRPMNTLFNRIYCDYVMTSRLTVHENIIRAAHLGGYAQISVRQFHRSLHDDTPSPGQKILVHRHDIDTDIRTTRKLFELEKKHNVKSSFYFRLSTLDFDLMREIEEYGSEASYHYEELATFAKKNKIRDAAGIAQRLPEIRELFAKNFRWIEQQYGKKMTTVASHGDFANRRLKVNNTEILNDQQLRASCGIQCETYDPSLLQNFDIYIADRPAPRDYYPTSPFEAIGRHDKICLLTHPRQHETNWKENTKDNLFRLYEGLNW